MSFIRSDCAPSASISAVFHASWVPHRAFLLL